MKKILLILVALLGLTATAQTGFKKSDKFVEGTFSYSKSKDADVAYTFNPSFGSFLTDKVAVGVSLETGNIVVNGQETGKKTSVGVFGRYYFLNVGKDFKVYSQLGVNACSLETNNYVSTDLGLGLNYFVTKNLALTTNLTSLANYSDQGTGYVFNVGFNKIDNPFTIPKFGVLYKF